MDTASLTTPTLATPILAMPLATQGAPQQGSQPTTPDPQTNPLQTELQEPGGERGGGAPATALKREEPKTEAPPQEPQNTSQEPTHPAEPSTPPALVQSEASTHRTPDVSVSLGYSSRTDDKEHGHHSNEKYLREQERLRSAWERAQEEVVEEERKHHQEERRLLEETLPPLSSPISSPLSSPLPPLSSPLPSLSSPRRGLQDPRPPPGSSWETPEPHDRQSVGSEAYRTSDISTADDSMKTAKSSFSLNSSQSEAAVHQAMHNGQKAPPLGPPMAPPPARSPTHNGKDCSTQQSNKPKGDRRSVSGRKLCSSCGRPLGKGAAMIIETLTLFFHIQCFKCGVCKGQLGDTTTGTDVRIRNGLLNCHQCYVRSRSAGQPTTL